MENNKKSTKGIENSQTDFSKEFYMNNENPTTEAKLRESAKISLEKELCGSHLEIIETESRLEDWIIDGMIDFLKSEAARQYWQEQNKPDFEELGNIRNELYDSLPKGNVDGWELLNVIKGHLIKLDDFILSKPYLTQPTESKESEWIDLPSKDLLKSGWWCLRLYQPKTQIESFVMHEVTNGLHGYAYATHAKFMNTEFKNTKVK